jgi:hypothetical protein
MVPTTTPHVSMNSGFDKRQTVDAAAKRPNADQLTTRALQRSIA